MMAVGTPQFAVDKLHEQFIEKAEERLDRLDPQTLLTFIVWLEAQVLKLVNDLPHLDDALDAAKMRGSIEGTRTLMELLRGRFEARMAAGAKEEEVTDGQ